MASCLSVIVTDKQKGADKLICSSAVNNAGPAAAHDLTQFISRATLRSWKLRGEVKKK